MFSTAQLTLLVTPWVLVGTTFVAFRFLVARLGYQRGYLAGFLFYWSLWGLLLPLALIGPQQLMDLFQDVPSRFGPFTGLGLVCFLLPLLLGYGYAFPRAIKSANLKIILFSFILALVNGTLEEVLWRGAYITLFPNQWFWGVLYPALGFGIWHFAPQSVIPNKAPGGNISLVVVATLVGLLWGWLAQSTGTILWVTISHILFDFSGLGARLYFADHKRAVPQSA